MGPQGAGGVAQVGRSWEGDRRGKKDREEGWRQTWRDRERHLHRERDTDREMGREKQGNREPERDRQREQKHESMWEKSIHMLRDRKIYTER